MDSIWYPSFPEVTTYPATFHIPSHNQPVWPQPQPQLDAPVLLENEQSKARGYTAKDWEAQKQEITRLYENNTLDSIMRIMRERYGLDATPKQYKNKIKKWGLNKNIQTHEMEFMIKKQQSRLLESGKLSAFRVRKRPVPPGKISRYIKDHGIEIPRNKDSNVDESTNSAVTPGAISCYTPSDTGPMTPHATGIPHNSLSPPLSFSRHGCSPRFGDPEPILPSSSLAYSPLFAQINVPDDSSMQPPSLVSIAGSPAASPFALVELDEDAFTGQSPAPFALPSTPQARDENLWKGGAAETVYDIYENMQARAQTWVLQQDGNRLGNEHPAMITTMNKLACVLEKQGRYKAAEQMERQTLELSKKVLGSEHPNTLTTIHKLTLVLMKQVRYEAAHQIGQQALELRKKVLGSGHPETLESMRTIAMVLINLQRYGEAERISRQALELSQNIIGPSHRDTLESMSSLAWALMRSGKHIEAERFEMQALEIRQKVLGAKHSDTLRSMCNLSDILGSQNRYIEAEDMLRQTLELRQMVLGPEHPHTLNTMHALAYTLENQRRYIEAEELYRRTLELRQIVLGPEHPHTLNTMHALAYTLDNQRRYIEAEELYRRTIALRKKTLSPEHPDILGAMSNLALMLDTQSRYIEAKQTHEQALELSLKAFGPEHPYTLDILHDLTVTLKKQSNYYGLQAQGGIENVGMYLDINCPIL
ncbi:hypothetical protein ACMFMG_010189 [Clarireedia jacksonii]